MHKRGLATYKTLSQEREETLKANQAELVRLEDQLLHLWEDLGDILIVITDDKVFMYLSPDQMIFCAKYAMCSIRFTKKFKHGNVSFFFYSSLHFSR